MRDRLETLALKDNHRRNTPETLQSDNEAGGNNHDAHPLLVFGAVAIILVVLILRPGTAARSSR